MRVYDNLSSETKLWIENTWDNIDQKLQKSAVRAANKLPYTAKAGVFNDMSGDNVTWWTNGFWPGLLWMMYGIEKKDVYCESARKAQTLLRKAFYEYNGLHHDVGFMWHISSGLCYRLTCDENARLEAMYAANLLAGRFNPDGGYIRAWNTNADKVDNTGWAIIDCMMNISLLYWASLETGDDRFAAVARRHADKTMENHVRADGSVRHIVEYDPHTGEFVKEYGGQGYGEGSSWSRGQAWGIYGFAISARYTKEQKYLDTAMKIANYFIASVCSDWLPRCDFRSPAEPVIYDSTAGAIAACGLLELCSLLDDDSANQYREAALRILQAMDKKFCDWDVDSDGILNMGTERYHGEKGRHMPIIYGDYFYVQAIAKLRGNEPQCW